MILMVSHIFGLGRIGICKEYLVFEVVMDRDEELKTYSHVISFLKLSLPRFVSVLEDCTYFFVVTSNTDVKLAEFLVKSFLKTSVINTMRE